MRPEVIDLCTASPNAESPSKKRRRIQSPKRVSMDMASVQQRRFALQKRHQEETRELKERQAKETDQLEHDIEAELESVGGLACVECGEVPANYFAVQAECARSTKVTRRNAMSVARCIAVLADTSWLICAGCVGMQGYCIVVILSRLCHVGR
jgi:hypothetical protein